MKKIIGAITVLLMCAAMLTACGDGTTAELQEDITTTTTAAETTTLKEEEPEETAIFEEDTTAANEENAAAADPDDKTESGSSGLKASFASVDELAEADISALVLKQTAAEDSYTYEFIKTLEGADSIYLDVESTDGKVAMIMAFDSGNNIVMDIREDSSGTVMKLLITNMTMYMLDPTTKTGLYYEVDESIFDEYNLEEALSQISVDESSISNSESIGTCAVQIGGKDYVFETSEGGGFLYDASGKLYAIISDDRSSEITALIVNEFSKNVPANAFNVPSDYELTDLMAAMAGLGG